MTDDQTIGSIATCGTRLEYARDARSVALASREVASLKSRCSTPLPAKGARKKLRRGMGIGRRGNACSMCGDWDRFEGMERQEMEEQLERIAQRQRLRRALELAKLKQWALTLQILDVEDSQFADFLRLHPELT